MAKDSEYEQQELPGVDWNGFVAGSCEIECMMIWDTKKHIWRRMTAKDLSGVDPES